MRKITFISLATLLSLSLFSQGKNTIVNDKLDLVYEPEPIATPVYTSNFENDADGWIVINEGGASSTLAVENSKLKLTVLSGGSDKWHIQVMKAGILLEKGQVYRMSFTVICNEPTAICYMGRNAEPWDAYSGYNSAAHSKQEETSFSYVFTMNEDTDPDARFVFNLGMMVGMTCVIGEATFSSIQIDKLEFPTDIAAIEQKNDLQLYLTPDQNQLCFFNEDGYSRISIFSLDGNLLAKHSLTAGYNEINASRWASGIYIVAVDGKGKNDVRKIYKK
ncbi:MAG: carbohydrate binding domain-containing protein [Tannerellaceae bacterium]|jgi:hypothetical protein|nr:carbohydrate binding domain-containing protein [Tannerellaceae bacterium]